SYQETGHETEETAHRDVIHLGVRLPGNLTDGHDGPPHQWSHDVRHEDGPGPRGALRSGVFAAHRRRPVCRSGAPDSDRAKSSNMILHRPPGRWRSWPDETDTDNEINLPTFRDVAASAADPDLLGMIESKGASFAVSLGIVWTSANNLARRSNIVKVSMV